MATPSKVRLEDGSEVGPLDATMIRSWFEQGLVDEATPVLPAGSRNWTRLDAAYDVSKWSGRRRAVADDEEEELEFVPEGRWRTQVASGVLLASAAVAGFVTVFPERWTGGLRMIPWREVALSLLALGLLLVRGWDFGRKVVRFLAVVGAFALFLPAGVLIAQGERDAPLLIVGCAWLFASGLFFLLARSLRPLGSGIALLACLGGAAGAAWLGLQPRNAASAAAPGGVERPAQK